MLPLPLEFTWASAWQTVSTTVTSLFGLILDNAALSSMILITFAVSLIIGIIKAITS